ncbi:WD repeat-containing protein 49 [Kryptolebias marmoratus]|uniref:WD repeat-containing protein 49 n=1 Tax=Kryptolebias marmoratus TaxID=37003 RepID=UPI000D5310BB|nr:WD repeat-containing protein 49 [Kryptolebias marmoratus]XP_024863359.1 WD repeat-containing protein 49 [Kryptolebias marmoratus]XP_024863360.1 WD repeat-containing protein 49 [Kryptolebias marmoratus]XP_024863361.1 WD repeat-containing protein 49 [Kryptolebias marmoratus]XP_024863362.1 WD repeat-containing protein 49 [Kryptolebias marmoratus]
MGTRMEVAQLESRMNVEDYQKLKSLFIDSSGASRSLSRAKFIDLTCAAVGRGSGEEYGLLFDAVVVTRRPRGLLLGGGSVKEDVRIDWSGLCSFLLQELSEKVKSSGGLHAPRWRPPRTLTCPHRDSVQKVLYLESSAWYLSVSKGGTVVVRDGGDMSILHARRLQNNAVRPKDLWVTDVAFLQNTDKIAVSFTCKEICFYDILPKRGFRCDYKLQGLRFVPWCLDYWADPCHPDQAVLTIGDIGGQVSALYFTSAQISLFERPKMKMDSDSADIILWNELVKGKHHFCYVKTHQAHAPAWVRKVLYLGSLEAVVSCSTSPRCSVAVGWKEKDSGSLQVSFHVTKRGVWDVDYHRGLRLIATAGVDHRVLLWNPYVTSEPACALAGHSSPVTAVRFLQTKQQLLSYSRDKVLCLWDVSSQLCLQHVTFPRTPEDARVLLFYQEEHQQLLLSFDSRLLLLEALKEERRTSSHEHPVTCVLYNSLFRQVVSSDSASSVICWLPDTGQKVKQFNRCHGNAAISTMGLDGTQTRLFTAGADRTVKVWDFSGRCLHRMNPALGRTGSISQVLLLRRTILVMGWKRVLTAFHLHSFSQPVVEPSEWNGGVQHDSNVLCAAFQPPQTLVTGSDDGEIVVWNSSTEKAVKKLQRQEGSTVITRLLFIPHRTSAKGGADLVSCGGLGAVRLWNIHRGQLVGQFTAHNGKLGSIVMAISPCGKYLVTADKEGTIKVWDIEHYCLKPEEQVSEELPELLDSFRPHLDHVTHLEICEHGDKLLLLSSSSDCSVALSYLPGETVGLFGQEDCWSLERFPPPQKIGWNQREIEDTGARSTTE